MLRSLAARVALAVGFAGIVALTSAQAQPFSAWANFSSGGHIAVPDSSALNPTSAFTFEAWVYEASASAVSEDCRSLAGKDYLSAWWVGICRVGGVRVIRAYLKGGASSKNGGIVPLNQWTHVAVVFDGSTQKHYINGELALSVPLTGPLSTSSSELRIGSDVSWDHPLGGSIDEVRLWNVARTTTQLRDNINVPITAAQPGLVAVWSLNGNANSVGGHNGTISGAVNFFNFAVSPNCGSSTVSALCLSSRFSITAQWRTNPTAGTPVDGDASVVVAGPDSGIFWFFSSSNWEVMVKTLNACGLNNRYWVFSAATTNVFYRMVVFDVRTGTRKVYFNYPGPPAPAVTDTSAFATCP